MKPTIQPFFHAPTNTVSYLLSDTQTGAAAIIDPVLDFDFKSGRTATTSADGILAAAAAEGLKVVWILETHIHADHLTASAHLKLKTGAATAIGNNVSKVQSVFKSTFGITDMVPDGHQFDRLLRDGDSLPLGALGIQVLHTPGHTPACVTYLVENAAFVGDTLFMPDYGTARADFPGGDARELYRSVRRILALPPETRLFMCHDYKAPGRDHYAWETTVAEQRRHNIHIHDGISEDEFVRMRGARDKSLSVPALILPAVQVNIRAGEFPPADANGTVYLKLPLNRL